MSVGVRRRLPYENHNDEDSTAHNKFFPQKKKHWFYSGLCSFLGAELTQGYSQPFCDDNDKKQHVLRNFMRTPKNLEALMGFGFLLCLHTFLYVFTFLPLRVMAAVGALTYNSLFKAR
jgi:hypothetical protein